MAGSDVRDGAGRVSGIAARRGHHRSRQPIRRGRPATHSFSRLGRRVVRDNAHVEHPEFQDEGDLGSRPASPRSRRTSAMFLGILGIGRLRLPGGAFMSRWRSTTCSLVSAKHNATKGARSASPAISGASVISPEFPPIEIDAAAAIVMRRGLPGTKMTYSYPTSCVGAHASFRALAVVIQPVAVTMFSDASSKPAELSGTPAFQTTERRLGSARS